MPDFDVLVVGGGTGNTVASAAADEGLETALIEKGPLGGTCLNRGCNPSKMLIQHAVVRNQIRDATRFGIDATVEDVQFGDIVRAVNDELADLADQKADAKRGQDHLTLFQQEARFVDDHTVALENGERYTADRIVIAAGSRPVVPDGIDGLTDGDYLTSDDAVELEDRPDHLIVLGGGYIAAELGYYFDAFGTDVTMIEMMETLLPNEDRAIGEAFTAIARDRHTIRTGYRVQAVHRDGDDVRVTAETEDGSTLEVDGDAVLVALGRQPNTDRIGLEETGVETTDEGFIDTDAQLRTSVEDVYAMGDIADNQMFKHGGDYEGEVVIDNVAHGDHREATFSGMPHAIFTEPQIGAVGQTETQLEEAGREYVVGRADYTDAAMARALKLDQGFVKVLADTTTQEVLGCHILGHEASMLIHEVAPAVRHGLTTDELADTVMHAHPALNKVVMKACQDLP